MLLYLLRRCYGLIYRLVASSEPISEELMPISNKLSTVSKCLREISKFSGPFTMRDLYPYKLALHQIDGMRTVVKGKDKDGNEIEMKKWLGREGSVPEGQAILKAQYEEVEQTIEEMLNREEEDEDSDEDDESNAWDGSAASGASISDDEASVSASAMSEDESSNLGGNNTGGRGRNDLDVGLMNNSGWNRWRDASAGSSGNNVTSPNSNYNPAGGNNLSYIGNLSQGGSNNGSYPTSPAEPNSFNNPTSSPFGQQQSQQISTQNKPTSSSSSPIPNTPEPLKNSLPSNSLLTNQYATTTTTTSTSHSSPEIQTPVALTNQNQLLQNQSDRSTMLKDSEALRSDSPTPKPTLQSPNSNPQQHSSPNASNLQTSPYTFGAVEPLSAQLNDSLNLTGNDGEQPVLLNVSPHPSS